MNKNEKQLEFIEEILNDDDKKEIDFLKIVRLRKKATLLPANLVMDDGKIYIEKNPEKVLTPEEIKKIKDFIGYNRYALQKILEKEIDAETFTPYFIKGKRVPDDGQKRWLVYKVDELAQYKDQAMRRDENEKKPDFIREKVGNEWEYPEDLIFYERFPEKYTGLRATIWIDEAEIYHHKHSLRVKMSAGYFEAIRDRNDIVEVDGDGNVYSCSKINENRYNIREEDLQAVVNFVHNNEYVLKQIADFKITSHAIMPHVIKGGVRATDEEIAKLNELTDHLSFVEHKNYDLHKMSLVNFGDDSCPDFAYPDYEVAVKSREKFGQKPLVRIFCVKERWKIRMSLEGEFLGFSRTVTNISNGFRDRKDKFQDIETAFKKWLPMKSKEFPEITNFVMIQRIWNAHNPKHRIEVKNEL